MARNGTDARELLLALERIFSFIFSGVSDLVLEDDNSAKFELQVRERPSIGHIMRVATILIQQDYSYSLVKNKYGYLVTVIVRNWY